MRAERFTPVLVSLMLAQSLTGLLFPGQYRDAEWIKATWIGNDWVTLVVAMPLLVASRAFAKASVRGLLLWAGVLAYAVYNYAYYLFGAALNVFFPLYLSALVVAALALMSALPHWDLAGIARNFRPGTPVRIVGGYFLFVGLGLASVWLAIWAAHMFAGRPTPIDSEAFKLVAALDSVLMVPALVIGGMLLWRRRAPGYAVAAVAGVQASLYLVVLSINAAIAITRQLVAWPGELVVWVPLALSTCGMTGLLLVNARPERISGAERNSTADVRSGPRDSPKRA
jgi:hypothetical protein